jgi:uncharacterized membrane protein YuzA (DUF378 family)
MRTLDVITCVLLVIGGLNWGLVGIFRFDLVAAIFGDMAIISRIVYILVGISALYQAVQWNAIHRRWGAATPVAQPHQV